MKKFFLFLFVLSGVLFVVAGNEKSDKQEMIKFLRAHKFGYKRSMPMRRLANLKKRSNITPLMFAALEGDERMVDLFCRNGANVKAKNVELVTALHCAVRKGSVPVVERLIAEGADIESDEIESPLSLAAFRGDIELVKSLVNNKQALKVTRASLQHLGLGVGAFLKLPNT